MTQICNKCQFIAKNKSQLKQHENSVHAEKVLCDYCNKEYKAHCLADHKLRCLGIKNHQCDLCSYKAVTIAEIKTHKKRLHAVEKKRYKCDHF